MEEVFHTTLLAARAGAEWAWRELYHDLAPGVLRYLRARGAPDPEELLGAVFLDVVRSLERFEGGEAQFRTWLFTIAHHRLVDEQRRRRRQPSEPVAPESLSDVPRGDAEADALRPFVDEEVRRRLDTLSDDQRDVVLLRVLIGLSIAETAEVLAKTPGAVKSLQVRGLARLEREIARSAVSPGSRPAINEMP